MTIQQLKNHIKQLSIEVSGGELVNTNVFGEPIYVDVVDYLTKREPWTFIYLLEKHSSQLQTSNFWENIINVDLFNTQDSTNNPYGAYNIFRTQYAEPAKAYSLTQEYADVFNNYYDGDVYTTTIHNQNVIIKRTYFWNSQNLEKNSVSYPSDIVNFPIFDDMVANRYIPQTNFLPSSSEYVFDINKYALIDSSANIVINKQ